MQAGGGESLCPEYPAHRGSELGGTTIGWVANVGAEDLGVLPEPLPEEQESQPVQRPVGILA